MGLGPSQWKCKDCGRKHRTDRKQCVGCGYSVLTPVDNERRLSRAVSVGLALLPAVLAVLTMGVLAWMLFF
ncbi:hypothetical protein NGM10_15885 (plasmid) [Halorussus salilacus]|uniref:hypothetical protein n=1 Tax=Halorussus salilacus TaxID=2953750 RepID=UPI00209E02DC|nr:hypothetical protein [Halorussus salilacus]USZ69884.1 hypothetical protein NGM10_15885 [Halorussus salilacus]